MAISYPLTAPTTPKAREMALQFQPRTAVSESPYTGQVQTYEHEGLVWSASISLPPLLNETTARDWHGFLAALNGRVGTFTMTPSQHATPKGTQAANFSVKTAAAIRATSLEVKGMTASATMDRGDLISISNRLYMLTETATADGSGDATLTLSHGLRAAAAVDDIVSVLNPVGTWRLAENGVSRRIQVGGVSSISLCAFSSTCKNSQRLSHPSDLS